MSTSTLTDVLPLEPLFGLSDGLATSAKQLELELIPMEWAQQFNALWHSVLPRTGNAMLWGDLNVAYAATFGGGVYAVAIWTRPVAANRMAHPVEHLAELRRLAIPDYAPRYTASRTLGLMRRALKASEPELCRLVSYQATDIHSGTIYRAANWRRATTSGHQDWTTHSDPRRRGTSSIQNASPKVRWELELRDCDVVDAD